VKIGWQGGEPTMMGLDFFREVIEVETELARPGDCIGNSLQTNGLVLDDEWCEFLAKNRFLVGLSIDGPAELNTMRKTHNGRPVSEQTMKAIELLKKYQVEYNILVVVSRANVDHPEEILEFLRENDLHYSQFIPCTEPTGESRATSEHSITPAEYGEFMTRLFDAWVAHDDPSYYIRRVDNWLHQFFGLPPECCEYREDCSNLITIEWNGDVYPCDFFVEPRYHMGNVAEQTLTRMLQGPEFRSFVKAAESIPETCEDCEVLGVCHAGCFRHRQKLGISQHEMPFLCEAKKKVFPHVFGRLKELIEDDEHPTLKEFLQRIGRDVALGRFGAQGQPQPAGPQAPQARGGQQRPAPRPAQGGPGRANGRGQAPPRNAPCPCGSGRKFKHCCGSKRARSRS
jgi:uncharacterized protein